MTNIIFRRCGLTRYVLMMVWRTLIYLSVMKRFFALAVFLIYSVSVSAVSLNLHFCGDYLNHISFGYENHGKCCCDTKPRKDNCCEDVKVSFSVSQAHASGDVVHTPESAKFFVLAFHKPDQLSTELVCVNNAIPECDTGPPEHCKPSSLFLRNNNLRI